MRVFASILALLFATPAFATGTVSCESPDQSAFVGLTVGSVPGAAIVGAALGFGETQWSIETGDIAVSQAFVEEGRWLIDFVDPNFERVMASVRLVEAIEGEDYVLAGLLSVPGEGAWPLICEGP
ncbi:MAG: hypothetical protein KDJ19_02125 [Hyphomicrobiaceae bacterium]|nr:hypothetical protein [Hyphomicrobiaceae bacterium]MCC0025269.1 hypothetical protein [Hyphomicrobiaceae bacterium]